MAGINYPTVNPNDVRGFAQAWDCNGIKMLLDGTSLKFAVDFANTVLRSYVDDLVAQAQAYKVKQAKLAAMKPAAEGATVPAEVATTPTVAKSSIILTD